MKNRAKSIALGTLLAGASAYNTAAQNISDILKNFENYSPTNYFDSAGIQTIGYGHKVKPSEHFYWMTKEQAEQQLAKDLSAAEKAVDKYIKIPLNIKQKAALTSLTYNIGNGAFGSSTLVRKLNSGDTNNAACEFDRWVYTTDPITKKKVKSKGLIDRRAKEKDLFLSN